MPPGFGSRSGNTGMTGTLHSNVMSLSRSDSRSSKNSQKYENLYKNSSEQFKNIVNENFDNDLDNIKNLASNYC
jgi:hypothetical protein